MRAGVHPGHGDSHSAAHIVAGAADEAGAYYFDDSGAVEFVAGSADIIRCSVADLRVA
ncbi:MULTISPECIES: hypothetical protein [unclassified Nocardia]|uniref:hypothetical protein n=1 Tax=unclassified Nocardia TaxID=2637762 RepID=UPI001CE462F5|nr:MULTISPECIES: hypothetical protein [unclassified Nocardia]